MSLRDRLTIVFAILVLLAGFAIVGSIVGTLRIDSTEELGLLPVVLLGAASIALVALVGGRALATAILKPLDRVLLDALRAGAALRTSGTVEWRDGGGDPAEVVAIYASMKRLVANVQAANEQREVVVAAVGHDLRTSLLSVRNVLSQLAEQEGADRKLLLAAVREETHRALHLTEQMTAVYAIDEHAAPDRIEQGIRPIVDDVVERVVRGSVRRDVQVLVEGNHFAPIDRTLVERGIENLVTNAVRVARSTVRIDLWPGLVRVVDDGPGLPPNYGDHMRHGTGRPGRSQVDPYRVGLGVYIARTSAERHGGRLTVERSDPSGTVLLWYYA